MNESDLNLLIAVYVFSGYDYNEAVVKAKSVKKAKDLEITLE